MQIAWIVYGALDQPTGGYVYDRLIVRGLVARGHAVDVVSLEPGARVADEDRARIAAADIVVGDELCFREVGRIFRGRERGRGPVRVLLVHHLAQWELETRASLAVRVGEARAFAHADLVIATSHLTAQRLAREGQLRHRGAGASHDHFVAVVEPGADRLVRASQLQPSSSQLQLQLLQSHSVAAGSIAFAFVGALSPRKGVLLLLDAFAPIAAPNITLRISGEPRDASYAALLRARVAGSPALAASVTFTGALSDEAVATELARADAVVIPSTFEGYGMIAAEAIHAHVPVIATRVGAIPEIAGAAGIVIDVGDANADLARNLSSALARFVTDPAFRSASRAAAIARADLLPRWDMQITAFEAALLQASARAAR